MAASFHWLDVQRIAEELADRHPEVDPVSVSFPRLRALVTELPGFAEPPSAASSRASCAALVSMVKPSSSSSPIVTISRFMAEI